MRRVLWTAAVNIDVLVALLLSVLFGFLDVVGAVSPSVMDGVIVLTLAALAVGMLHNRLRDATGVLDVRRQLDQWFGHEAIKSASGIDITRELENARRENDFWQFKGATGTYTRAVTLPELARKAVAQHLKHVIILEILDPDKPRLCENYAQFFRGLSKPDTDSEARWTGDGTRREILATIFAACWYEQKYTPLEIHVRLSATYEILRWELTRDRLIITHRGPSYPALVIRKGNPYFNIWGMELDESRKQSRRLPLHTVGEVRLSTEPTPDEARALFTHLGVGIPETYTDSDLQAIIDSALHARNPYA